MHTGGGNHKQPLGWMLKVELVNIQSNNTANI